MDTPNSAERWNKRTVARNIFSNIKILFQVLPYSQFSMCFIYYSVLHNTILYSYPPLINLTSSENGRLAAMTE